MTDDCHTLENILSKQAADSECQAAAQKGKHPTSCYSYSHDGILVRKTHVDGALQKVVPATLRARILYLSRYLALAGHTQDKCVYDTMRKDFYWPHMRKDVYTLVNECHSCAQNRSYVVRQKLQHFQRQDLLNL